MEHFFHNIYYFGDKNSTSLYINWVKQLKEINKTICLWTRSHEAPIWSAPNVRPSIRLNHVLRNKQTNTASPLTFSMCLCVCIDTTFVTFPEHGAWYTTPFVVCMSWNIIEAVCVIHDPVCLFWTLVYKWMYYWILRVNFPVNSYFKKL
jgi:hypothetical protein